MNSDGQKEPPEETFIDYSCVKDRRFENDGVLVEAVDNYWVEGEAYQIYLPAIRAALVENEGGSQNEGLNYAEQRNVTLESTPRNRMLEGVRGIQYALQEEEYEIDKQEQSW